MVAKRDLRWIRRRLERVRVHSCADGTFTLEARWKEPYMVRMDEEMLTRSLPPGLFTRMDTAEELEKLINESILAVQPE